VVVGEYEGGRVVVINECEGASVGVLLACARNGGMNITNVNACACKGEVDALGCLQSE
jgi:hypothetical protein